MACSQAFPEVSTFVMKMLADPPNETDEEPPPLVVVVAFVGHADGVVPLHPDVREQVVDVKRVVLGVGGGASAPGFEDCGTGSSTASSNKREEVGDDLPLLLAVHRLM